MVINIQIENLYKEQTVIFENLSDGAIIYQNLESEKNEDQNNHQSKNERINNYLGTKVALKHLN